MKITQSAVFGLALAAAVAASAQTPDASKTAPPNSVGTNPAPTAPSANPPGSLNTNAGPKDGSTTPANAMGTDSSAKKHKTHKKKTPAQQTPSGSPQS